MITIRNTPPPERNGATLVKSTGAKLHKRPVNPHAIPNGKSRQGIEKHSNPATGLCSPMGKKISRPLLEEKARRLYERGRAACKAGLHEDAENYFLASLDYWERLGSGVGIVETAIEFAALERARNRHRSAETILKAALSREENMPRKLTEQLLKALSGG